MASLLDQLPAFTAGVGSLAVAEASSDAAPLVDSAAAQRCAGAARLAHSVAAPCAEVDR
jgi:hypothetical protein